MKVKYEILLKITFRISLFYLFILLGYAIMTWLILNFKVWNEINRTCYAITYHFNHSQGFLNHGSEFYNLRLCPYATGVGLLYFFHYFFKRFIRLGCWNVCVPCPGGWTCLKSFGHIGWPLGICSISKQKFIRYGSSLGIPTGCITSPTIAIVRVVAISICNFTVNAFFPISIIDLCIVVIIFCEERGSYIVDYYINQK